MKISLILCTLKIAASFLTGEDVSAVQSSAVRIDAAEMSGTLIVGGDQCALSSVLEVFIAVGEQNGQVVVLDLCGDPVAPVLPEDASSSVAELLKLKGVKSVRCVRPELSGSEGGVETAGLLRDVSSVWICEPRQDPAAASSWRGTLQQQLISVLRRGGTVVIENCRDGRSPETGGSPEVQKDGGSSGGIELLPECSICCRHSFAPGCLLQSEPVDELFAVPRDRNSGRIILQITEQAVLLCAGRAITNAGGGVIRILLPAGGPSLSSEYRLQTGEGADLIQLRRAVRQRLRQRSAGPGTEFSDRSRGGTAEPGTLRTVPFGSLVIAGGGHLPQEAVARFLELAGGTEARIVVLPAGLPPEDRHRHEIPDFLKSAKTTSLSLLSQSQVSEIQATEFREALKTATGIWFSGGRQWRFVDAYEDTVAVALFHDVLRRGGVIGGSSAGATIQGDYLVRGHPLGNHVVMAEGYEQGFAFLPGAAIDQHFSQRRRHADLTAVVRQHPQLLGIGIDEDTAIIVRGSTAEVLGGNAVHLIDAGLLTADASAESLDGEHEDPRKCFVSFRQGDRIDLRTLKRVAASPNVK